MVQVPPARQHVLKAMVLPAPANAELGHCLCSTATHAWPLANECERCEDT